jgi:hypothetical protein
MKNLIENFSKMLDIHKMNVIRKISTVIIICLGSCHSISQTEEFYLITSEIMTEKHEHLQQLENKIYLFRDNLLVIRFEDCSCIEKIVNAVPIRVNCGTHMSSLALLN